MELCKNLKKTFFFSLNTTTKCKMRPVPFLQIIPYYGSPCFTGSNKCPAVMWLQFTIKKKKKVCDPLVVSVSGRVLSTPGRAHMQMPTHTFKNHNASCINPNAVKHIRAHRHRITQRARGGWGGVCPDLWVPSQRGCCSASYNRTTDSLCSSCKFCSLSFGAQKSSVLSCEKDEGEGRRGEEGGGVEDAREEREEWSCGLCANF